MAISSQHHSFDVALAAEFSIEEAILIHHFQHWVRINRSLKRNQIEGRTWTYQTQEEIAAHFPYWNRDVIQRLLRKLVNKGVLLQDNFNKSAYDRTKWYAFVNEGKFVTFIDNVRNCTMDEAMSRNGTSEIAQPIPDTKTDSKTDFKEKEKKETVASPPEPPFVKFRENVYLKSNDYNSLLNEFGSHLVDSIVEELDLYAKINPKKFRSYKDHAAVIRSWILKNKRTSKGTSWKPLQITTSDSKPNSLAKDTRVQPSQKSLLEMLTEKK